jgi:hypothetical protein
MMILENCGTLRGSYAKLELSRLINTLLDNARDQVSSNLPGYWCCGPGSCFIALIHI